MLIADAAGKQVFAQAPAATATTLGVTSSGSGVTTVSAGSVIQLTASVTGSGPLTRGQVNFCDASASVCTGIHLLGMAQLTSAGTATLKFRPAIGSHSYKAVFLGTKSYTGSSSSVATLAVTGTVGPFSTSTSISKAGSWGNYSLTATVTEVGGAASPTGTASFLDTSNGNSVLATAPLGAGTLGATLLAQTAVTLGSNAGPILTGDFNGDGIPDVAVSTASSIVVYLGNGDGTFNSTPVTTSLGGTEISGVVADFNGDGIQDLALIYVNNYGADNLGIFLGTGNGSFTPPAATPSAGTNPVNIAASADFNNDGIADLAVSSATQTIILLGNGDGTFTATPASPIAVPPGIVIGDFNGDGKPDLAAASSSGAALLIAFGNGDGTFASPITVNTGLSSSEIIPAIYAGDLNADGKTDIVFIAQGVLLLGNGDGTFTSTSLGFPAATQGRTVMVGDFNGDGIIDIFAQVADNGDDEIEGLLLLGNGDGTFLLSGNPIQLAYAVGPYVAAADLNGDGRTDLVYSTRNSSIAGQLAEPTQVATATVTAIDPPAAGQHLVDASYSGDGSYTTSTSGATTIWGQPPTTTTTLALAAGAAPVTSVNAGTVITLTATVVAGTSPLTTGQVNFCDATANDCTDIHLIGVAALTANGTAAFKFVPGPGQHSYKAVLQESSGGVKSSSAAATLTVGSLPSVVYPAMASIAQSGSVGNYTLTATVTESGGSAPITGNVSFLDTSYANNVLASGPLTSSPGLTWSLASSSPSAINGNSSIAVGDFNGDGIIDVAAINDKTISIFLGKGDGTFNTAAALTLSQYVTGVVAGDFNGDGKLDIAASVAGATYNGPGYVQIYLGNGDGTFSTVSSEPMISGSAAVFAVADINGDGKLDLVVNDDNNMGILLGNGDGTFAQGPATGASATGYSALFAVADLNGDGVPDLVTAGDGSYSVQVYLGNGDGTFRQTEQALSLTGTEIPSAAAVGDFNGDGIPDISVIGGSGGIATVFLGKGDGTFTQAPASPNIPGIYEPESMVAADFNHDGKLDLAITNGNSYSGNAGNPDLTVLLGNGDGTFTNTFVDTQLSQTYQVLAADVNGNGTPDLIVGTGAAVNVLETLPTQTAIATATGVSPSGPAPHLVAANYPGDSNYSSNTSGTTSLNVQLAAPVFTQPSGAYTSIPSISITDATPGATIQCSPSGTATITLSSTCNGPISIYSSGTLTVQAYATETGYLQSATTTATYTFTLSPAPAPVFSVAAGFYPGTQTVTITDAQPGVPIFYTTNGSTPYQRSTPYTGPITVSSSETLSAVAAGGGYSFSPVTSAQYFIGSSSSAFIYTIAGNDSVGYAGDGGPATTASLNNPLSVVADSAGNVYIADYGNNVVRRIDAVTKNISTIAGTGIAGYSGDTGPATSAQLRFPIALALDASGNLFISDLGNQVVRKVAAGTGIITTYAGNPSATALGDNGPATSAQIIEAEGLAVDSAGNLYIATYQRVREVNAGSGIITTVAGGGYSIGGGIAGYSGDNGPATSATLNDPIALAVDSAGNLYIGDYGVNVVRKVAAGTGIITTVAGVASTNNGLFPRFGGDGGPATSAYLYEPSGVAVDSAGNLFIADSGNFAIRKVTAGTGIITTVVGIPPSCISLSGDGGPANNAGLCLPRSIALDGAGNMYIAVPSQNRVREVTASVPTPTAATAAPVFTVAAGTYPGPQTVTISDATPGAEIYVTMDGTTPTTAQLAGYYKPINVSGSVTIQAIAVAPGYLPSSVATAAYTITSPPISVINTIAGTGTSGSAGSGGLAINQQLSNVNGLAADSSGNLYLADPGNDVIWKFVPGTGTISVVAGILDQYGYGPVASGVPATSTGLNGPTRAALDPSGNLYISDSGNGVVRKVSAQTGIITTYAGGGAYSTASGDGGPATSAYIPSPEGLAVDSAGNLYIADTSHNTVRKVTPAGTISTVAGAAGVSVIFSGGFSGDGGLATSALLTSPSDLAVDSQGNLYIADEGGLRIRMVAAGTGIINTIAGNGNVGEIDNGGAATGTQISARGLVVDASGNLYFANGPNSIRKLSAATGVISTIAGNGFTGFYGDGGSATLAELSSPEGLAFDPRGNLFVADTSNYRIRKITFPVTPAITWVPAALTYGTALGSAQLNATASTPGVFTYSPALGTILSAGSQTLSATFTPTDTTDYNTTTGTATLAVNQAPLTLAANSAARVFGAANPTFTGTIGGVVNGDTITESFSTVATVASVVGTYPIVPAASGANIADYSVSATNGTLTVSQAGTATTFALSNNNLTFTANVASATTGTPTGTVTFYEGQTAVGTGTLSGGVATYTVTSLPTTSVTLSAQYGGDTNFTGSSSTAIQLLAIAPITASLTVPASGAVTDSIGVTVPSGYIGSVQFSCTGLPQYATCSFSPTSLNFNGSSSTGSVTVTITTGAMASLAAPRLPSSRSRLPILAALFLPGLLGLTLSSRRLRWNTRMHRLLMLLLLAGIASVMTACGGAGAGSGGGGSTTSNQTPAGTSTVQVVANGPGGLTQTTSLTLTVQ